MKLGTVFLVLGVFVALGSVLGFVTTTSEDSHLPRDKTAAPESAFASSRACRSCHPDQYASWYRTYHRSMTQVATPDAIAQAWDGVSLSRGGRTYHLRREGNRFFVDMPRMATKGEAPEDRVLLPVVQTTGSHHMQSYWMPAPWLDEPPETQGRDRFEKHCAACHGPGGQGLEDGERSLLAADLGTNVVQFLGPDDETHLEILEELGSEDVERIVRYVERLQFPGRLTMFPFTWFIREQRWVFDGLTYLQPGPREYPVEPYGNNWDDKCDGCHATYADYAWDGDAQRGFSEAVELGIACEECHGPAARHVARHRNPLERYRRHFSPNASEDDIVNPAKLNHELASAICAQCHAELIDKDPGVEAFHPGDPIEQYAHVLRRYGEPPYPDWIQEALEDNRDLIHDSFWPDGTILIAGRDYNGLVESACFTRGEMSCLSCHSMHEAEPNDQLRREARGNDACLSCHQELATDLTAHTHHAPESSGSQCYNCHMPHTTWGLLGAMRAHRIDSPSVAVSVSTGRPNACNLCHLDTSLGDASDRLTAWYGQPAVELTVEERDIAASILWLIKGNGLQRAILAWHMSWKPALAASGDTWQAAYLSQVLNDPYPAVRHAAGRSLHALPGFDAFAYDYTDASHIHDAAAVLARQRWLALFPSLGTRPSLLLTDGAIDWNLVAALQALRDNARIEVDE